MKKNLVILLVLLGMAVKAEPPCFYNKVVLSSDKKKIFIFTLFKEEGVLPDTILGVLYFIDGVAVKFIDSNRVNYLGSHHGVCPLPDSIVTHGPKIFRVRQYIKRQLMLTRNGLSVDINPFESKFVLSFDKKLIYGLLWCSLLITAILSVVCLGFGFPFNRPRLIIVILFLCTFLFFLLRTSPRLASGDFVDSAIMSGILFLPAFLLSFLFKNRKKQKREPNEITIG